MLKFQSSKGNNSAHTSPIEMKIMLRTTAHNDEPTYQVWSWSDKKCRSSFRDKQKLLKFQSSKGNKSTRPIGMKTVLHTAAYYDEPTHQVWSRSDKNV